ncbi:putative ubiquitin carboxyl-terminal hydrolase [Gregarina niphandrodes]|uniref:Ubiquitin carboxyl-terminal hydrolase n=1 Tax=Gregarina niphandrodes TaxID=110365 RepID=A0A023B2N2_GRENI|nr:putative ubiquitin carboxyl-terminal hydrolase [Gregarina niphandrodes]EZG55060.1 putative ubiquitin carboxyl-terminal hydrolase [Gregarina niphandrodes]|eukprot:XP_011131806.1 putative ubiquitin carboxyl-terminal hydrolase [Gregarina niphandrodes]
MLRNANKVSSYWNATDQQDALEFFDFLMDASYCYDMLFTGKLERQYICTGCDSICRRQESYRNISVTCNAQVRSLKGALDNYQAPEYLTGDNLYDCDRCKIKTVGKCQTWIQKYPSVLTISLIKYDVNRESGCYGKVNNLIKIDLELPFEARCGGQSNIDVDEIEDGDKVNGGGKVNGGRERSRDSGHNSRGFGTENEDRDLDLVSDASTTDTNQNSIIRYKLTSIILHIGASVASGHYVTVVRRQQEWFLVDDHKVSRLTSQELDRLLNNEEPTSTPPKTERDRIIDNRNTYLLFYTRTM